VSVTPTRDRRSERHEATRAEILEAAWELAREQGLAAVSLRDLGKKVGMRAQSLYSYFDSKHAIYDAMFARGVADFLERTRQLGSSGNPRDDVRAAARMFFGFCVEDPARYQLLFQRTIPGFEPSPESFAPSVEGLELLGQRLADAGADDPADLDLCTALITGLVDQQISNDPGGDRWYRLLDEAVDMYFARIDTRTNRRRR
jgi:AcrR family transcriptional regulator